MFKNIILVLKKKTFKIVTALLLLTIFFLTISSNLVIVITLVLFFETIQSSIEYLLYPLHNFTIEETILPFFVINSIIFYTILIFLTKTKLNLLHITLASVNKTNNYFSKTNKVLFKKNNLTSLILTYQYKQLN